MIKSATRLLLPPTLLLFLPNLFLFFGFRWRFDLGPLLPPTRQRQVQIWRYDGIVNWHWVPIFIKIRIIIQQKRLVLCRVIIVGLRDEERIQIIELILD